jgi:hypothetical protein
VIFEGGPVQIVGAALNLDINCSAGCETLLCIKAIGDNVNRLNRFQCRDVSRYVGQPDIVLAGAINANVVRTVGGAVDIERQSA